MIEENYNFTYKVNQVSIENGCFDVQYIPESPNLTPLGLNLFLTPIDYTSILDSNNELVYKSQEEVPFELHIEYSVKMNFPIQLWKNQYALQKNISNLTNVSGKIDNNATKYNLYYTSTRPLILDKV